MEININDITFIIVTYKSESVIKTCLDTLPKHSKKIIVENSKNIELKNDLESNYDNIEVIMNENLGMGASNNVGIHLSKTKYVYILNPDAKFKENTIGNLLRTTQNIKDFSIISPKHEDDTYPNYKIYTNNNSVELSKEIISVDTIDGFSMLINKEKFINESIFDEKIFLYLENDDLCLRSKKKGDDLYIIKNSLIEHSGSSSTGIENKKLEYLRNWHWMWSKFYFNKKHYGYIFSLFTVSSNFFSGCLKFLFYLIIFNSHKRNIYKIRIFGLLNSMLGKKSWYR